jgi:hypothetical protein
VELLSALHTPLFFIVLLGLVKRSLWVPLLRALRFPVRLYRFVWISSGLFYDHLEIESKSSRFWCLPPRPLDASNLFRYKASYHCCSTTIYLFLNLLSRRSGHPFADLYQYLSVGPALELAGWLAMEHGRRRRVQGNGCVCVRACGGSLGGGHRRSG